MMTLATNMQQSESWLRRLFRPSVTGNCVDSVSDSARDSRGDSTRTSGAAGDSPRRARLPLRNMSAEVHAERLLLWLQEPGGLTGRILVDDLRAIHGEMCLHLGWRIRPWQPIARQLALRLSGGRKTWAWVEGATGERVRRRVYFIPEPIEQEKQLPADRLAA